MNTVRSVIKVLSTKRAVYTTYITVQLALTMRIYSAQGSAMVVYGTVNFELLNFLSVIIYVEFM